MLDEKSTNGRGYLAEVCRDWEAATKPTPMPGSRVVIMRNGVVLSSKGGALPEMLRPFKLGVGGKIGDGNQYLSWIDLDDMVRAILWVIDHPEIAGPVNAMAPNPVTNREFTAGRVRSPEETGAHSGAGLRAEADVRRDGDGDDTRESAGNPVRARPRRGSSSITPTSWNRSPRHRRDEPSTAGLPIGKRGGFAL